MGGGPPPSVGLGTVWVVGPLLWVLHGWWAPSLSRTGYCVGSGSPPLGTVWVVGPLPRVGLGTVWVVGPSLEFHHKTIYKKILLLSHLRSLSPSFSERLSPLLSLSFISNSHVYIGKYTRVPQKLDTVYIF